MLFSRFLTLLVVAIVYHASANLLSDVHLLSKYAVGAAKPLLRCFQVYTPVLIEEDKGQFVLTDGYHDHQPVYHPPSPSNCFEKQTLMVHSFANSYGVPFVGDFKPPSCNFDKVTLNLTVTAAGKQFDRLARLYLGDTEIWRTSTAEPTADGIVWTYIKDVTEYSVLFRQPQKVIFELGNIVNANYTAPFNTTLEATFSNVGSSVTVPDVIVPVSARLGSQGKASVWEYPKANATNTFKIPRNVNLAYFSISATGQSDEEFWYTNVLSSQTQTFAATNNTLLGQSPFREVQLFIDGRLAGVALPFPVIFTGGISPGFWRPLVGIDAFDLKESIIDVSPWLALLCDGKDHTYTIKIAGISDNGKNQGQLSDQIGSYWDITGKLFLFLDSNNASVTTGTAPQLTVPDPSITITSSMGKSKAGANSSLFDTISVSRDLRITATLHTANRTRKAAWFQSYKYSNTNNLTEQGLDQYTKQLASGYDVSDYGIARRFSYPIEVGTKVTDNATSGSLSVAANLIRGQEIVTLGYPIFPTGLDDFQHNGPGPQGTWLTTTQNGTSTFTATKKGASSVGRTSQNYKLQGVQGDIIPLMGSLANDAAHGTIPFGKWLAGGTVEVYERNVVAGNNTVVSDRESINGRSQSATPDVQEAAANNVADLGVPLRSIHAMLGRGPASGFDLSGPP